jgi:hypothetical protein
MLAVIHHMLATERVPLDEVVSLAADLTSDLALNRIRRPRRSHVPRLSRGRDELYAYLTVELFEQTVGRALPHDTQASRERRRATLYLLRKRA